MYTPRCHYKGCTWTGKPKDSNVLADQAVRMHIGRIHVKNIKTPKGPMKHRRGRAAVAPVAGQIPLVPGGVPMKTPRVDRRSRVWRIAHPDEAKPINRRHPRAIASTNGAVEVKVNFCSNCGAPIEGQAQAIVLAGLLRRSPKFRAKVDKLLSKYA